MSLERRLADRLVQDHPDRAARVLERLGAEHSAPLLARTAAPVAASVLRRLAPHTAAAVVAALAPQRAADLLAELPLDVAARLLRRQDDAAREAILGILSPDRAAKLRRLLHYAPGTAGGLMDPDVLALPEDFTAREARTRVRQMPELARYNLYVVDREQRLVGALNLRELLLARPGRRLAELMVRNPQRLEAHTDRAGVISHPGWKEVHSLPVVDERGAFLGAVRYRTLRELEGALLAGRAEDHDTQEALGQLFAAGAGAVLDALTGSGRRPAGGA